MLVYIDNEFCNGPDIEFETLDEAKLNRKDFVDFVALNIRNKVTANTSPAEMASWPLKLAEANAGGGPMLALEAQYRGITTADLVAKVLNKANQLSMLEAQISGVAGKHNDSIDALTVMQEVIMYDPRADWPLV